MKIEPFESQEAQEKRMTIAEEDIADTEKASALARGVVTDSNNNLHYYKIGKIVFVSGMCPINRNEQNI